MSLFEQTVILFIMIFLVGILVGMAIENLRQKSLKVLKKKLEEKQQQNNMKK